MSYRKSALILALAALVFSPGWALAQEDSEDGNASAEEAEEAPSSGDPLADAKALGGDVVIMKSGAIMGGVQVLRSTSHVYEIQVVEGAEPLIIPRKQVEDVIEDDIDPLRDARRRAKYPDGEPEIRIAEGQEVSEELTTKLMAPVPGTPFKIENEDYTAVFARIAKAAQLKIDVDPSLQNLEPEVRMWTAEVPEGIKLVALLQNHWDVKFPDATYTYEKNRVVLHKKGVKPQPVQEAPVGQVAIPQINLRR